MARIYNNSDQNKTRITKAKQPIDQEFLNQLTFEPLSKDNWGKFVQLFGNKGACGNCWCMSFRLKKHDFDEGKANDGNKTAMKELVWDDKPTGILGFYEGQPIAWCAFAPREDYLKLENSRVHKRIDDKAVWSIPCFFIDKNFRRLGVSVELLKAVVKYAQHEKIKIIEAYPTIPTQEKLPDAFAWIGLYKSFDRAGFTIVDRTSKNRPMVRFYTDK
jgi:GNAT superfamily N-acetyltransferase